MYMYIFFYLSKKISNTIKIRIQLNVNDDPLHKFKYHKMRLDNRADKLFLQQSFPTLKKNNNTSKLRPQLFQIIFIYLHNYVNYSIEKNRFERANFYGQSL